MARGRRKSAVAAAPSAPGHLPMPAPQLQPQVPGMAKGGKVSATNPDNKRMHEQYAESGSAPGVGRARGGKVRC